MGLIQQQANFELFIQHIEQSNPLGKKFNLLEIGKLYNLSQIELAAKIHVKNIENQEVAELTNTFIQEYSEYMSKLQETDSEASDKKPTI